MSPSEAAALKRKVDELSADNANVYYLKIKPLLYELIDQIAASGGGAVTIDDFFSLSSGSVTGVYRLAGVAPSGRNYYEKVGGTEDDVIVWALGTSPDRWRFLEAGSEVYHSNDDVADPTLCTTWILDSGANPLPSFSRLYSGTLQEILEKLSLEIKSGGGGGSISSNDVDNDSGVVGAFVTDALTTLDTYKADLVGGTVPASQLPAYVDDVLEFDDLSLFPATGGWLSSMSATNNRLVFGAAFTANVTQYYDNSRNNQVIYFRNLLTGPEVASIYNGGTQRTLRGLTFASAIPVSWWEFGGRQDSAIVIDLLGSNHLTIVPGTAYSAFP